MTALPRVLSATLFLCLLAAPAAASQRLPEWVYDDVSQTLTFLDSTGSPVQLGTVNPSTHAIALSVSGGVLSTVPGGGTGDTTFSANLPLIGNGTAAIAQGTRSGTTTIFATSSGALTNGHCVTIDASGNFVDAGGACTTGGAGGVVNSGLISQLAYYASAGTAVSGLATAASSVLTTGSGSIPAWATILPCVNVAAISGDVTGSAGSCSGRTVTGIQGVAVGTPTGTASSGAVLATSPTITTPTINQPIVMGDTSAGSPAAGQVGEILSATGTAVSLTTSAVAQTITSKSITAGHWSCTTNGATTSAAATTTFAVFSVSLTNNVNGAVPGIYQTQYGGGAASSAEAGSAGPVYYNFTSPTTVYAVADAQFSGGTVTVTMELDCRRIW